MLPLLLALLACASACKGVGTFLSRFSLFFRIPPADLRNAHFVLPTGHVTHRRARERLAASKECHSKERNKKKNKKKKGKEENERKRLPPGS